MLIIGAGGGRRAGGRWLGGMDRVLRAVVLSPFLPQTLRFLFAPERQADLLWLRDEIEVGKVTPVIEQTYALSEVPEALRHIETYTAGKVIITVRGSDSP